MLRRIFSYVRIQLSQSSAVTSIPLLFVVSSKFFFWFFLRVQRKTQFFSHSIELKKILQQNDRRVWPKVTRTNLRSNTYRTSERADPEFELKKKHTRYKCSRIWLKFNRDTVYIVYWISLTTWNVTLTVKSYIYLYSHIFYLCSHIFIINKIFCDKEDLRILLF